MTYDLDALEAAGLLQAMYWRRGWYTHRVSTEGRMVKVETLNSHLVFDPRLARIVATDIWSEL